MTGAPATGAPVTGAPVTGAPVTGRWHSVLGDDGRRIALRCLTGAGGRGRRATCILAHGMMLNGRSLDVPRRAGLASSLAERGHDVYVVDLRGHGRSRGPGRPHWSFDDLVRDVGTVVRHVRLRHPDRAVVGVGHSLGGLALLGHAAAATGSPQAIDGVVAIATTVWLPHLEHGRLARLSRRAVCDMAALVALICGEVPASRLHLGPEPVPRTFVADVRRWWRDDRWAAPSGRPYVPAGTALPPVLAVLAAGDRFWSPPGAARAFWEEVGGGSVHVRVVGGDRSPLPGHVDLVLRPEHRRVWSDVATWIEGTVIGDRPGGPCRPAAEAGGSR